MPVASLFSNADDHPSIPRLFQLAYRILSFNTAFSYTHTWFSYSPTHLFSSPSYIHHCLNHPLQYLSLCFFLSPTFCRPPFLRHPSPFPCLVLLSLMTWLWICGDEERQANSRTIVVKGQKIKRAIKTGNLLWECSLVISGATLIKFHSQSCLIWTE